MKLLIAALILLPSIGYSATYNCHFTTDEGDGNLRIAIKGSKASIELSNSGKNYTYKNCKVEKDDIGILVDCNAGSLDFMVLLNNEVRPASGGIMSSTHELFADVDC
jgi:hypothetical protein